VNAQCKCPCDILKENGIIDKLNQSINTSCSISNYKILCSITNNYPSYDIAWHARKNFSYILGNQKEKGFSQIGSNFFDDANYSYSNYYIYCKNKNYPKAYNYINNINLNKINYSEPEKWSPIWKLKGDIQENLSMIEAKYSYAKYYNLSKNYIKAYAYIVKYLNSGEAKINDAWKLKGDIQKNLNDIINKTGSDYAYAKYYNNIKSSDISNDYLIKFLNQVYSENISQENIIKGILSDSWRMMKNYSDNVSQSVFYAAYADYPNISSANLSNIESNANNYRDYWYLLGLIYRNDNRFADAAISFKKSLAFSKNISHINTMNLLYLYYCLGDSLIKLSDSGDISDGYYYLAMHYQKIKPGLVPECIDKSIASNPSNHRAWHLRGEINSFNTNFANYCFAKEEYMMENLTGAHLHLSKSNERYREVLLLRAMIYEKEGNLTQSYDYYDKSAKNTSLNSFNKSEENELRSEAYMGLGRMTILCNNSSDESYESALLSFAESLNKSPHNYNAWTLMASALFYTGEIDAAQSIFSYSFGASINVSKDKYYWNRKGEILASRGWYNAALDCFNNSTNQSQYFRRAWLNKGLVKINLGNYEDAINDLDKAARLVSGNETNDKDIRAKARMNMAIANSFLKQYDDALVNLGEAIGLNPSQEILIDIYYTKGLILLDIGQEDEAVLSFFESLNRINKSSRISSDKNRQIAKAWHGLGRAFSKMGDNQRALKCYNNCTNLDSSFDEAWIDKGRMEMLLGKEAESLISYNMALDAIRHNQAETWCDLGYAWEELTHDKEHVFSWTKIPGNDDKRLKEFLRKKYKIDWVYTAGINKSEDNKTISISQKDKNLSLTLNDEDSEVILKIDNNETDKFIAKKENGEKKIYDEEIKLNIYDANKYLDCFNNSIMLDESLILAYYNKSDILKASSNYSALSIIQNASYIDSSVISDPKFNFLKGIIYFNLGVKNLSLDALRKSYYSSNETKYNINLLSFIAKNYNYSDFITNSKTNDSFLMVMLGSLKNYSQSNSSEQTRPFISDLLLLQDKLIHSRKLESQLMLRIAESKYGLNLTDSAIQSYIAARKMGFLDNTDEKSMIFINLLFWAFLISGLCYLILILFDFKDINIGLILILSNLIGFLAFSNLLANIFDSSRAMWSLFVQLSISCIFIFYYFIFNDRLIGLSKKVELTLGNLTVYGIKFCRIFYMFPLIYSIILSLVIVFQYNFIIIGNDLSINSNGFVIIRSLMLLILGILIPMTAIPLGLALASEWVDNRLRKVFAFIQFAYLSVTSVPLIWLFWSYGMPVGFPTKIPIEDKVISIPVYSVFLSLLFFAAFILPYYKGFKKYNSMLSKKLAKQKEWLSNAEKSPDNLGKLTEDVYRELISELKLIFGNSTFCESKRFLNSSVCSPVIENLLANSNKMGFQKDFAKLKDILKNDARWDEKDTRISLINNSELIMELAEEQKIKNNLNSAKRRSGNDPSSIPTRVSLEFAGSASQLVFENANLNDPFAEPRKNISEFEAKKVSESALWTGYATVIVSPIITLAVSWIVYSMKIPMDQGNLSQLISNAVSVSSPLI
jgi:tetratricopeptide (TPR) repeat protein